jgi:uncharacterized protein YndB with AHSA1/START domain
VHDDRPTGPIRWRMHLRVPPRRVFEALDSASGRAAFWAVSAEERNDAIEFVFRDGHRHVGRCVERDPPRTWAVTYFGGTARFELDDDGAGGTDLLLNHEGVPAAEWTETHAGWLNVLFPMKAWLEHGVELRNGDPRRTWSHGYADG